MNAWLAVGTAALAVAALVACSRFPLGPVRRALTRRSRAESRAEALLLAWLSPEQRSQYGVHGWFDVVAPGGNCYRVRPRKVVRLDAHRAAYCIEASYWVPEADQMLAKKLLLETDERRFLATAYRYR